jgi:excisionase family DNA binding protein
MTDMPDRPDEYMTVTEAAARLLVNDKTVRRWIERGYFPGTIRLSPQRKSEYRIPLKAIEQFEETRKVS